MTTLRDLRIEARRKAAEVKPQEDWTERNTAALEAHSARLQAALLENLHRLRDNEHDPRWKKWFRQALEATHVQVSINTVKERGHWVACPVHGIEGVEGQDGEACASYGLVLGGEWYEYARYCEACANLDGAAQTTYERWEAMK